MDIKPKEATAHPLRYEAGEYRIGSAVIGSGSFIRMVGDRESCLVAARADRLVMMLPKEGPRQVRHFVPLGDMLGARFFVVGL